MAGELIGRWEIDGKEFAGWRMEERAVRRREEGLGKHEFKIGNTQFQKKMKWAKMIIRRMETNTALENLGF